MSYSFSVIGASKEEAGVQVAVKLEEVVASQSVHEADRQIAQDTAEELIDLLNDPKEGEEIKVSVSGWLSWGYVEGAPSGFTGVNVSVSANIGPKS